MKAIYFFDLKSYIKNWQFTLSILSLIVFGIFAGNVANFTLSDNLAYNSPYQIAFITAFISLTAIFFSTFLVAQLNLKEFEHGFDSIFFSIPITIRRFLWGRFLSVYSLSLLSTLLLTIAFFIGRGMRVTDELSTNFSLYYYLVSLVLFTSLNTFLVVAITSAVAWLSKSKILVYVSGLLLYVFYMVAMIFSSSPFMANQMPQSKQAQLISAIFDPFGISSFFYQAGFMSVDQKNTELFNINGVFLANRIGITIIASLLLLLIAQRFTISKKGKYTKQAESEKLKSYSIPFRFVATKQTRKFHLPPIISFVKINILYVVKSIPFALIALGLMFAVGMEFYGEIEKGIRLPQKYASSGLMLSTIIQNFHFFGAMIVVFYGNDLFWRARASNFHLIEQSTFYYRTKFLSIGLTLITIIFFFTSLLILEGVVFQWMYNYPRIEMAVYAKAYLYNSIPLILVAGLTMSIQAALKNRYLSLAVSAILVVFMTSSLGKLILKHPLLKFLNNISLDYSDLNGFGPYELFFIKRLIFGALLISILLLLSWKGIQFFSKWKNWASLLGLLGLSIILATNINSGYRANDRSSNESQAISYEQQYRKYQHTAQPTIVDVHSQVDLFPTENRYTIRGKYILENRTSTPINQILVNFPDDFSVDTATLVYRGQKILVSKQFQIVQLKDSLFPAEQASFEFEMRYHWTPVNGHQSFNAIIENGSFMRISRFYPTIGYQAGFEIEDKTLRKANGLGDATSVKPLTAPKESEQDFINLDLIVSTELDQTAVAVGELQKQWTEQNRTYFHYRAENIPFRFAISSARYQVEKLQYRGKLFEVYFHPSHFENVSYLLENAKATMDYCEKNFGIYPFKTIRFAEVSGFTQGFSATAYPATIYMTEQMSFHCNIKADKKQDVINELAGHELAHIWWGNNQISPDNREGSVFLTETLAMYTELMLLKKMYGKIKMEEAVAVHQQIFEEGKGIFGDYPLVRVKGEQTHISYSKGAVMMYKLSELIGEESVNQALRNFLLKHKYPNRKPIATDFLEELYNVTDKRFHESIQEMFMR